VFWWNPDSCPIACYAHAVRPCFVSFDGAGFRRTRYAKGKPPYYQAFFPFRPKDGCSSIVELVNDILFDPHLLVFHERENIQKPWLAIYFIKWENVLKSLVKIKKHTLKSQSMTYFKTYSNYGKYDIVYKNNADWWDSLIMIRFACQSFVTEVANKMAEYKTIKTF
jgi:hypothetical protein